MAKVPISKFCKSPKMLAGFLVIVFVTVTFFGVNVGMEMGQDGIMSGCVFDQSVACPMDIQEHIAQWQQTFIAVYSEKGGMLLSIILLLVGVGTILPFFLHYLNDDLELRFNSVKIHKQRNIFAKLFDPLVQALSDGILNPKIYNESQLSS